jgi:hypothetical protein
MSYSKKKKAIKIKKINPKDYNIIITKHAYERYIEDCESNYINIFKKEIIYNNIENLVKNSIHTPKSLFWVNTLRNDDWFMAFIIEENTIIIKTMMYKYSDRRI